jgi:drug/metabolite transporter (DMT)-like permease
MPLHLVSPPTESSEATERTTEQDPLVDAPASLVYYDDPDGVVCARGVCVLAEDSDFFQAGTDDDTNRSFLDKILTSYLGPRLLLGGASVLYGTNFALGALMNEAMPPSAATAARTVMAALALSPFLFQLNPAFAGSAALCGCFTALGYITQSMALIDTSPATVSFIGAAVVLVCPILESVVDKKALGWKEAPQVWLAASLCLLGVGILELYDPATGSWGVNDIGFGDFLALLQAIGFGTSFFLTERMMRGRPDQALPITAVQVSMSALLCMVWCFADGWMDLDGSSRFILPNMFFEPTLTQAAWAVAWTGLITTAMNRVIETTALGKVSSAEASVILATEPLFAALFSAWLLHEQFGLNDYLGGVLIVGACFATALKPAAFERFFPK